MTWKTLERVLKVKKVVGDNLGVSLLKLEIIWEKITSLKGHVTLSMAASCSKSSPSQVWWQ